MPKHCHGCRFNQHQQSPTSVATAAPLSPPIVPKFLSSHYVANQPWVWMCSAEVQLYTALVLPFVFLFPFEHLPCSENWELGLIFCALCTHFVFTWSVFYYSFSVQLEYCCALYVWHPGQRWEAFKQCPRLGLFTNPQSTHVLRVRLYYCLKKTLFPELLFM